MNCISTIFRFGVLVLATVSTCTIAGLNHLEPIGLVNTDVYATCNSIIQSKDREQLLWMIKDPSLSKSIHAIVIDAKVEYETEGDVAEFKSMQCYLRFVSTIPPEPYDRTLKYRPVTSENLERHEIPIDEKFATLMSNAWQSVLKQTKYADKTLMYLDGTAYIFGSNRYCGMTISPDSGIPLMLVELADQLSLLAQANESDKEAIQNKCIELAKSITENTNPNQGMEPTRANDF